jgi:hypothetical protein
LNARLVGERREGAVYVGRPSPFGNPFVIGRDGSREDVVQRYPAWIVDRPELAAAARRELRGKDLICWCAPAACHAQVLIEIANSED